MSHSSNLDLHRLFDEFIRKLELSVNYDEDGVDFWYARKLQEILEYKEWLLFQEVIKKAAYAACSAGMAVEKNFQEIFTDIEGKKESDYRLTRYACYMIAQNADAGNKAIALAQTYFATLVRKQEIEQEREQEIERRVELREMSKKENKKLTKAAKNAGVRNYGAFQNAGYRGLYNGKTSSDIAKYKKLPESATILDHMGSEELGANLFRITQATGKIQREKVKGESAANKINYDAGLLVRDTIEKMGNTMPEDLPTAENIKKIAQQKKKLQKANDKDFKKVEKKEQRS
ncbi:DNA-damage-inducible protein D [Candidatus Fokinia solitaria]|uniref:DNA-damage-inducible protein D n=1 Tax=Candidatus Fokinia solitaria TaxID=1802984 RepID=A0A2U8BRI5_9RICK|nr:DNA damage-inducible protein D [Candidatus Fokinia solitaria]AWD32880.1 DNA-damage-inducible protein D [Candidatus Fokinia solitaria]